MNGTSNGTSNGTNGHHEGPRPMILCGPSGSGKTSLMRKLTDEFKDAFGFSVSHTTRNPRPGQSDRCQIIKLNCIIDHEWVPMHR